VHTLQLEPPYPVIVTSKDNKKGYAFLMTDYGMEHDRIWSVVMNDSGEIWDVPNHEIRMQKNWTAGRRIDQSTPRKS
jgi:hypothetical protein